MGETNEAELLQWFGPPTSRGISTRNNSLEWHKMLHVSLGLNGKVIEWCREF